MSSCTARAYRAPKHEAIDPVALTCPHCDAPLGLALGVTVESARQAAKRPPLPEAFVTCPSCHRAWIAGLWLHTSSLAGEEMAAA